MYQNSHTALTDIQDGSSNTLLVGNRCNSPRTAWSKGARRDLGGMLGVQSGATYISCVMWWLDVAPYDINGTGYQAFSSWHPGGAQFVFGDGSVRFFPESADITTFRWLAGRSDGMIVSPDF